MTYPVKVAELLVQAAKWYAVGSERHRRTKWARDMLKVARKREVKQ